MVAKIFLKILKNKIIILSKNRGKGYAIKKGLANATYDKNCSF